MHPQPVNNALTVNRRGGQEPTRRPAARARRRRQEVENTDYAAFAGRVIRAHGRRIADGDVEGLAELLALAAELDAATRVGSRGFGSAGTRGARSPPGSGPAGRPRSRGGAGDPR